MGGDTGVRRGRRSAGLFLDRADRRICPQGHREDPCVSHGRGGERGRRRSHALSPGLHRHAHPGDQPGKPCSECGGGPEGGVYARYRPAAHAQDRHREHGHRGGGAGNSQGQTGPRLSSEGRGGFARLREKTALVHRAGHRPGGHRAGAGGGEHRDREIHPRP